MNKIYERQSIVPYPKEDSFIEKEYQDNSPVGKQKQMIQHLVDGHWSYIEKLLKTGVNVDTTYSFDELIKIREFDYKTAGIHFYGHGFEDALSEDLSFKECIQWQKDWATKTFGEGDHALGLTEHIQKEIKEIKENPFDVEEWIDVIILAMEGAWRTGASVSEVSDVFKMKMRKNERRLWPTENDPNKAIEHVKGA